MKASLAVAACLAVGLALAAASALHAHGSGTPGTVPQTAANAMAIDADPSTPAIDTSRSITGTAPFDIGIGITQAGVGYQGYQAELSWVDLGLDYVSDASLMPAGMIVCATPSQPPPIRGTESVLGIGCTRTSGTTAFTGLTDRLTLQCHADGAFVVHLVTIAEDPNFGTTTIAQSSSNIPTGTADATISCTGTGVTLPHVDADGHKHPHSHHHSDMDTERNGDDHVHADYHADAKSNPDGDAGVR